MGKNLQDTNEDVSKIMTHLNQQMKAGTYLHFDKAKTTLPTDVKTTYLAELNRMASLISDEVNPEGINKVVTDAINEMLQAENAASLQNILESHPSAAFDLLANYIKDRGKRWVSEILDKRPPSKEDGGRST